MEDLASLHRDFAAIRLSRGQIDDLSDGADSPDAITAHYRDVERDSDSE